MHRQYVYTSAGPFSPCGTRPGALAVSVASHMPAESIWPSTCRRQSTHVHQPALPSSREISPRVSLSTPESVCLSGCPSVHPSVRLSPNERTDSMNPSIHPPAAIPPHRLFPPRLSNQPLRKPPQMVIDGARALGRRRGGVGARTQGLLDGRAAAAVVAGRGPAGWFFFGVSTCVSSAVFCLVRWGGAYPGPKT